MIRLVVVDIDGTLYDHRAIVRRMYAGETVSFARESLGMPPHRQVVDFINTYAQRGAHVQVLTARYPEDTADTVALLDQIGLRWHALAFRDHGATDIAFKRGWLQDNVTDPASTLAVEDNPYLADMFEQHGVRVVHVPGWDCPPGDLSLALPEVVA